MSGQASILLKVIPNIMDIMKGSDTEFVIED